MDKQNNKSIIKQNHQQEGKLSLILGGIIVLIIAISPFVFYSYRSFSDSQVWETSLFSLKTNFPSWYYYSWYLVGKIVPLYLLFIWFFSCKHWWYWIILVPISMYAFQFWGLIVESNAIDENELYFVLPIMMILIPAVYVIRAKLFDKVRGDDLKTFEEELGHKRTTWQQIRDLFR